jgi:amino acid transporter
VLFAGIAVAAVFVLRMREPDAPRPFKALGYPVAPAIFTLTSLLIVVNAILGDPGPSGAGVLIMAAGSPIYWWMTRRKGKPEIGNLKPEIKFWTSDFTILGASLRQSFELAAVAHSTARRNVNLEGQGRVSVGPHSMRCGPGSTCKRWKVPS